MHLFPRDGKSASQMSHDCLNYCLDFVTTWCISAVWACDRHQRPQWHCQVIQWGPIWHLVSKTTLCGSPGRSMDWLLLQGHSLHTAQPSHTVAATGILNIHSPPSGLLLKEAQPWWTLNATIFYMPITVTHYSQHYQLECGPMPNVMAALLHIGGALCSTPQSLADAHY